MIIIQKTQFLPTKKLYYYKVICVGIFMSFFIKKTNSLLDQTQKYLEIYNKSNGTNYRSIIQIKPAEITTKDLENLKYERAEYPQNAEKKGFSQKLKSRLFPTPPAVLKNILGPNQSIQRDFNDLGTFYSAKQLFKSPVQHYISVDTAKSTWANTVKTNDISCIYNKQKQLERIYVYNWEKKTISIFDKDGQLIQSYTPEQTHAMLKYKHDSRDIHRILRYNCKVKNEAEVRENIKHLTKVFEEHKTDIATDDIIAYRALDPATLNKLFSMTGDSIIFEDPSFVSVATKKSSVYPFLNLKNFRHILKIKIPKGSEYLQMDNIGHIVVPQPAENELLLKGKFLITKNNGKFEAVFLGDKNIYAEV